MAIGRDVVRQIGQLLRPLQVRIANSIARAVVQFVDDSTKLQILQLGVLAGEVLDDAERFQEYGFASVPLPGAEAVVIFPNGDRSHPLVVAVDDRRYRPTGGEPGEVVVYNQAGALCRLRADGTIELTPAPGGEVLIGGGASLAFQAHVHLDSTGNLTTEPTGVPIPNASFNPLVPPSTPANPMNLPSPAAGTSTLKAG